jgi:hypothetical protein
LTAANDSDLDAATVSAGTLKISAGALGVGGNLAANDIDIDATGLITAAANTVNVTANGTIDIAAAGIASIGAIGGNATKSIAISASNDAYTSNLDGNIDANDSVTLKDGKFDATGIAITSTSVVISGDTDVIGAPDITAESVTITSTNDVVLGDLKEETDGEGIVLSAGSASGAVTAVFTGDTASGNINAITGSGNDTLTLNEVALFAVNTGGGNDKVTITDAAASSVVNTGTGDDIVDDDEIVAITVNTGDGNDTYTPVAGSKSTVDMGDGTADKLILGNITTSGTLTVENYEIMDISAGNASISTAQFNKDNSFQLTGANTLTIRGGGTEAVTIDASNLTFDIGAVANLDIAGSTKDDTITGSAGVDVIKGAAGNDTITTGAGADDVVIVATDAGVDTITDFTSGTDDLDINGFTNSKVGKELLHTDVASASAAVTLDNTNGITEITGTLQSTPTDFSNGTQVLAAVSGTSVSVGTDGDDVLMVLYSGGKAYVYLVAEDGSDVGTTIEADEITLLATLDNIAAGGLNPGDFI